MNVLDFMRGLGASVASNNPVTMAVDTGANIADLGIAAAGYLGHKTGMLTADQLPDPLDKSKIPGSTAWLEKQAGVNDSTAATAGTLAGMFVNPGKAAKPFIQKAEYIFGTKGANERIARAKSMMAQGASKEDVWRKTGVTEFGPDHWVTEVSSQGVHFKILPFEAQVGEPYNLRDVINHPGLDAIQSKRAQEKINNTKVRFFPMDHPKMEGARGGHVIGQNGTEIWIGYDKNDPLTVERGLSTALHEMQHNLSSILGGWKGGNVAAYVDDIGVEAYNQAQRTRQGATFAELLKKNNGDIKKAEEQFVKRFPDSGTWSEDEWIQMRHAASELAANMDIKWIEEIKNKATDQVNKIREYKKFGLEKGIGNARYADVEYLKYIKQADEAAARAVQARAKMSQQELYANPFWEDGFMDSTNQFYNKAVRVGFEDLEFDPRRLGGGLAP